MTFNPWANISMASSINSSGNFSTSFYNIDFPSMLGTMMAWLGSPYGNNGQLLFTGLIFLTLLGIVWIRGDSLAPPAFLFVILLGILDATKLVPVQWAWLLVAGAGLSFAGVLYAAWNKT